MDDAQLMAFCDYMIGGRVVGGNADEPTETPHSPELRAFIVARLGALIPDSGYRAVIGVLQQSRLRNPHYECQSKAFAALLREVADGIDPVETILAAPGIIEATKAAKEIWDDMAYRRGTHDLASVKYNDDPIYQEVIGKWATIIRGAIADSKS